MLTLDKFTEDKLESVEMCALSITLTGHHLTFNPIQLLGILFIFANGLIHFQGRTDVMQQKFENAVSSFLLFRSHLYGCWQSGHLNPYPPLRSCRACTTHVQHLLEPC